MSVTVAGLSKIYGQQKAVNNISFEVKQGEVMGFLGPNGAGKTTTMKIISCFIPQTAGEVQVCGFDVRKDAMQVRQQIGYLPEHNPLYHNMYVKEYLQFVGRLHGLGKKLSGRIADMIEQTGLVREQKKKIGQLSKGYRQRVGLAQAMLHNPKVLILDEPTSGLDPNQLAEIRQLIKMLGKEKTVILSTHIMQEVQAVCSRVVIIDKGKIVANDTATNLQEYVLQKNSFIVEFVERIKPELLQKITAIAQIQALPNNQWLLQATNNEDIRADIFRFAVQQNLTLLTLQKKTGNLEDVFRELTK